jgi:hypothetical protein
MSEEGVSERFNFAVLFYMKLAELMEAKDKAICRNDTISWFFALKAIYLKISFQVRKYPKGNSKMTAQQEIENDLSFIENSLNKVTQQNQKFMNYNISKRLEKVDKRLMYIMDHFKMIFPKIKEPPGFAGVRREMKLHHEKFGHEHD